MDAATIFRNLVTNKFMPEFDYARTRFSFQTVYYKSAVSYCCCPCGFEHEYCQYITDTGALDEDIYKKIVVNIIEGKCPHVDKRPVEYLRETSVNAILIACVVGTERVLKDHFDKLASTRTCGIFRLGVYEITTMKNKYHNLELCCNVHPKTSGICRGIRLLCAKCLDNGVQTVRFDVMSILEYFIQERNTMMFKSVLNPDIVHAHIDKAFRLIFRYQLTEMRDALSEYHMCLLGKGTCFLPTFCAETAIMYNQTKVLRGILSRCSSRTRMSEGTKRKLVDVCSLLTRTDCENILLQNNFPKPKILSEHRQLSELLRLLEDFYDDFKNEIIDLIKKIPNIHKLINTAVRGTGPDGWPLPPTHYYIKENIKQLDSRVVKAIFDLGGNVDLYSNATSNYTPLMQLLCFMTPSDDLLAFRKILKVILNENPSPTLNKDAVKIGIQLDFCLNTPKLSVDKSELTGEYIMDGKEHSVYGYDNEDNFPLNFVAPLLMECGFPYTRSTLLYALKILLHPIEHVYIQKSLENLALPKSLKLSCRDNLRKHYRGRKIHKFVERSNIPIALKEYILLESLLNIN